jgi:rhodanese-related sulfurtransferase
MATFSTISVTRLAELNDQQNVDIIDVRMPTEYQSVHAIDARNIPLDSLNPDDVMNQRNSTANEPLYVICQSGTRSRNACEKFVAAGFTKVISVEGGTKAWDDAGLPVVRGKQSMSLERQVRITAGFLVLLGTSLGIFVHPYLLGLPAFVGAGLMFAGITDTCGMAMMLAKMPWNKISTPGECSV